MSDGNSESGRRPDDWGTLPADRVRRNDLADSFGGLSDEEARAAVSEHVTGSWRRKGQSRAEGLVTGAADDERPSADERTHPWTPGLHMDVRARGHWSRATGSSTAASATAAMPTRSTATVT